MRSNKSLSLIHISGTTQILDEIIKDTSGKKAQELNEACLLYTSICGSTSISADKKGFGVGKAVVGVAIAGPIGLVGGNIGAKKVRVTCLNCGHQWIAGKAK